MKLRNALFKYVQRNTFVMQRWRDICAAKPIIFVFSSYNFYELQNETEPRHFPNHQVAP